MLTFQPLLKLATTPFSNGGNDFINTLINILVVITPIRCSSFTSVALLYSGVVSVVDDLCSISAHCIVKIPNIKSNSRENISAFLVRRLTSVVVQYLHKQ